MINRSDLAGLIPEPVTREIFQGVTEQSAVLRAGRKLPNMTSKTQTINVLDMLPIAYWVDGDMGFKQTAAQAWEKKKLHAEELAVIIPIPEAVLADTNYDIWAEVKPRIVEAMGRRVDEAIGEEAMIHADAAIARWIEQGNYRNVGLKMPDVAGQMDLPYYLLRSWLRRQNLKFSDWMAGLRVEEAKRIIREHPSWTNETIASRCGFRDRTAFQRKFKDITGMTPADFAS